MRFLFLAVFLAALAATAAPASAEMQYSLGKPAFVLDENGPAPASGYTCAPHRIFLTRMENGAYRLTGRLPVPTPGYTYKVTREAKSVDNVIHLSLRLKAPKGAALAVVSDIDIDHTLTSKSPVEGLNLRLEKEFNWGDDTITCKKSQHGEKTYDRDDIIR